MNIRYAALLSGFVLIAAVPVLADQVSDLSYKNASAYAQSHSTLNGAFDVPTPKSTLALVAAFTSSPNGEVQFEKLSDSGTFGHAYSISDSEKAWGKDKDGDGDHDRDHKKSAAPVAVPEPGSLSLLLIGLLGIGGLAYRRGEKQKDVSAARGF
jgi:PEP-CTERM motif-containing protein